jgi:hypothetical protein
VSGTVYLLAPDTDRAVGGVRKIYELTDALVAAGIAAAVVHASPGFRCSWFANATPVVAAASVALGAGDVVVVPEIWLGRVPTLAPGVAKVILNQNAYKTFTRGVGAAVAVAVHTHPDVVGTVVTSADNAELYAYAFPDLAVRVIRPSVDPDRYRPEPGDALVLSYIPRKRAQEATDVLALLELRGALAGWEVVAIEGMDESAYAATLRRSKVFLSFSSREGFGLPPIEALAAGCTVVGFDGFGGRETLHGHAHTVEDGNVLAMARAAETVLAGRAERDPALDRAAAEARRYVIEHHAPARQAEEAVAAFGAYLDAASVRPAPPSAAGLEPFWRPPGRLRLAAHQLKEVVRGLGR